MVGALNYMKDNFSNMITEISAVLGEMGRGNYRVTVEQEYVGEFVKIKARFITVWVGNGDFLPVRNRTAKNCRRRKGEKYEPYEKKVESARAYR